MKESGIRKRIGGINVRIVDQKLSGIILRQNGILLRIDGILGAEYSLMNS